MARTNEKKNKGKRLDWLRALFADRARVLQAAISIVTLAIVVTVIATLVVAQGPLLTQATKLRTARFSVAFDWPPLAGKSTSRTGRADAEPATWMNREMRAELEHLALKLLNDDPFDGKSLQRTRDALRETGWFAEGPWLMRHENGVIVISGKWRVPAAAVRIGDKDRLVAGRGELLVPEYPKGRSGFKAILGGGAPPSTLGEAWPGGGVQAGLALLNFLRPMPGFDQIESVDVSDYLASKKLSLVTTSGGRIVWGGAPGQFVPGQASAAAKRDRLVTVQQRFGQLDAGRSMLDVRPEDGVYLHDNGYAARSAMAKK
jgi:hypothetical protein